MGVNHLVLEVRIYVFYVLSSNFVIYHGNLGRIKPPFTRFLRWKIKRSAVLLKELFSMIQNAGCSISYEYINNYKTYFLQRVED